MIDALTPTTAVEIRPTLADSSLAIDGNDATFATLTTAPGPGAVAEIGGFAAGAVSPLARTRASLRVVTTWAGADSGDFIYVSVSKDSGTSWKVVSTIDFSDVFNVAPGSPVAAVFDVLGLIGTASPTNVRFRLQFEDSAPGADRPPIYTGG